MGAIKEDFMARQLMPKAGIMMPYVVVSRDAAVVGVSTVDGLAGAIDLTKKYLSLSAASEQYMKKTDAYTKTEVNNLINPIMEKALFKDDPYVNNNTPIRSGGGGGVTSVDMIKVDTSNKIILGDYSANVQGVQIKSKGRLQILDLDGNNKERVDNVYSTAHRPETSEVPFAVIGDYTKDSQGRVIGVNKTGVNSDIKQLTGLTTALSVSQGGTGAKDAASARTNLGLGTGNNVTFGGLNTANTYSNPMTITSINPTIKFVETDKPTGAPDYTFIMDGGNWRIQNETDKSSILGYSYSNKTLTLNGVLSLSTTLQVNNGGTGARDAATARANLGVRFAAGGTLGTSNLGNYLGEQQGLYFQQMSANATVGNGYPSGATTAGTLQVLQNGGNGAAGSIQMYYPFTRGFGFCHFRRYDASAKQFEPGGWAEVLNTDGDIAGGNTATKNDFNLMKTNAVGFGYGTATNHPGFTGTVLSYAHRRFPDYQTQIATAYSGSSSMKFRTYNADSAKVWNAWATVWTDRNTTVDANGFIKRASPIVKVFGDGKFELNEESEGVNVVRLDKGVYKITNCLGLNSDAAWGGISGGIETPKDMNNQPLIWVDYDVDSDGSVILKTYHRTHPDAPAFAQNNKEGYNNGDPIDIPSDVFVSVRVEMPEDSIYNQHIKEVELTFKDYEYEMSKEMEEGE